MKNISPRLLGFFESTIDTLSNARNIISKTRKLPFYMPFEIQLEISDCSSLTPSLVGGKNVKFHPFRNFPASKIDLFK